MSKSPNPANTAAIDIVAQTIETVYPNRLTHEEAEHLARATIQGLHKKGFKVKVKQKEKTK